MRISDWSSDVCSSDLTSPEHYANIISTRTFQDRLDTLEEVRAAGINVCSGGIVGLGEMLADRVGFIHALATLPEHPGSVPVNALNPIKGTVLGATLAATPLADLDDNEVRSSSEWDKC